MGCRNPRAPRDSDLRLIDRSGGFSGKFFCEAELQGRKKHRREAVFLNGVNLGVTRSVERVRRSYY